MASERRFEHDGVVMDIPLRLGGFPAVMSGIGAVLLLLGLALGGRGLSGPALVETVTFKPPSEAQLGRLASYVDGGFTAYARCRVPALTDDIDADPGYLSSHPVLELRAQEFLDGFVIRSGAGCRPPEWVGLGSQLEELPTSLRAGEPVRNPIWEAGAVVSPQSLAEAEMRLHHRLRAEYELIHEIPSLDAYVPPPTQVVMDRFDPMGLLSVLAGIISALLGIGVLLAGLSWPRVQRIRVGSRGVQIDDLRIAAAEIEGVAVVGSRLVVTCRSGKVIRSDRVRFTEDLEAAVRAFDLLEPAPVQPDAPLELEALTRDGRMGGAVARMEGPHS